MFQTLKIKRLSGNIGAEIGNVDLSQPLDQSVIDEISLAHAKYGVIFFRDQTITPEQHEAFTRRFGDLTDVLYVKTVDGHGSMSEVVKNEEDKANIGGSWHADQTFQDYPPKGAVLVARELPDIGGDTLFTSMACVYEALSPGLQQLLEGLNVVHSNERLVATLNKNLIGQNQPVREVIHPAVIRNLLTGRKSVFLTPFYVMRFEGWSAEDSQPLLSYLYRLAERPEFQVRFTWQAGSIAFWDNWQVWHYAANDYHGKRRSMHRLAIKGTGFLRGSDPFDAPVRAEPAHASLG
jgi:taurine dioxygenase